MHFGTTAAGINHQYVQQFPLLCTAQITIVRLRIYLPDVESGGVAPLAVGDTLQFQVMDASNTVIMSSDYIISEASGNHYLDFDFTGQEFQLVAGTYAWSLCVFFGAN